MARPRARRLAPVLVATALSAVTAGSAAAQQVPGGTRNDVAATAMPAGTGRIVVEHCTLVDHSRETPEVRDPARPLPSRTIGVELRLAPGAAEPHLERRGARARAPGPPTRPLLVFAPGYDAVPDLYAPLLNDWARAGFVVAGLVFPATNPEAVRAAQPYSTEQDIVHQPADVAFAIRSLRDVASGKDRTGCPPARGLDLTGSVAIAGQSDGASTVAALAYDVADRPLTAGLGLSAAVVLAGAAWGPGAAAGYRFASGDPPLLMAQGTADTCNPPQAAVALYDDVHPPRGWFLALRGVGHLPAFVGTDASGLAAVAEVSERFLDEARAPAAATSQLRGAGRSLLGGGPVLAQLRRALATTATLSVGPVAPRLAPRRWSLAGCSLRG